MEITRLINKMKGKIWNNFKPLKYAEIVGVNFPKGKLHLYGKIAWGTEPWIITLGENVYITQGVKFITHDGGTLLYRHIVPDLEITKPIKIGNNVYICRESLHLGHLQGEEKDRALMKYYGYSGNSKGIYF